MVKSLLIQSKRKEFNMENNLQIVNISGVSCYEKDNIAYLRIDDVARGLGFTKKADSGNEVVNWTRVRQYLADFGVVQKCTTGDYIPENIFYRLAMKAKNETAEKFQALVADEIIPSVRRHGGYIAGQEELTPQELMAKALMVAQKTLEEREARIAGMTKQIEIMAPKVSYYDAVLNSKSLVSITEIAKDYGMSGKAMNKLLHDKKIQYKVNDTWVLYEKYHDKGYTGTKTAVFGSSEGSSYSRESTYWTQKGRLFIYDVMKKDGKIPVMEQENN